MADENSEQSRIEEIKQVLLLSDSQIKELKAISKSGGLAVAELIRRAVDDYICSYTPSTHLAEHLNKRQRERDSDA